MDRQIQTPLLALHLSERARTTLCSLSQVSTPARAQAKSVLRASLSRRPEAGEGAQTGIKDIFDRRIAMYVSGWPSLSPGYFFQTKSPEQKPFPLSAANRHYFYVARNGIYHLFRALNFKKGETVLVPDYHSGNEVWAIRAAGASVVYYHIKRNLEPDLDELEQLCRTHNSKALYVIHFLGWPQPMAPLTALCRQRKMLLIEDCALSLLSESEGKALGSFGDYAVFCLYKTLP